MNTIQGGVTAAAGFLASGIHCGIKKAGLPDLALIFSETPCSAAGLFTTNRVVAAPVRLTRIHSASGRLQAIVANSGNANACTGKKGESAAMETVNLVARQLKIAPRLVAVASTGVIGEPLPMEPIRIGIPDIVKRLRPGGNRDAARAIMTTDTKSKETAVRLTIRGRTITVGGMAKGSGMIQPDMATMLTFLTTDIRIKSSLLRKMLTAAVERSFNRITVDGETSTNDMILCLANGKAANSDLDGSASDRRKFQMALDTVCLRLARMIVEDGEGATKLIEIRVRGAASTRQARTIAKRVANSNLVKTAFFGQDPNWGRIMAAIGASGENINPDRIELNLGRVPLVKRGVGLGRAAERRSAGVLKKPFVLLTVDLHRGSASAVVWTCDLSEDYVRINASYRS